MTVERIQYSDYHDIILSASICNYFRSMTGILNSVRKSLLKSDLIAIFLLLTSLPRKKLFPVLSVCIHNVILFSEEKDWM